MNGTEGAYHMLAVYLTESSFVLWLKTEGRHNVVSAYL